MPVFSCSMYGYSGLHFLRRVAAHLLVNGQLPGPCRDSPNDDPVVDECYEEIGSMQDARSDEWKRFDHLLCHSDCEGFYVPVPFDEVLFDFGDTGIGPWLGSSQSLERECTSLAEAMGLPLDLDAEGDEVLAACESQGDGEGWRRFGKESHSCLQLLEAARHSVKHGAAIVFC